jgi:hypothetical protein
MLTQAFLRPNLSTTKLHRIWNFDEKHRLSLSKTGLPRPLEDTSGPRGCNIPLASSPSGSGRFAATF